MDRVECNARFLRRGSSLSRCTSLCWRRFSSEPKGEAQCGETKEQQAVSRHKWERGDGECISARGWQLRKARLPPLHENDKPAADLIRGRKQGAFSLSAISVIVR